MKKIFKFIFTSFPLVTASSMAIFLWKKCRYTRENRAKTIV
ncbi:hypothetical protein NW733_06965 [Mycoplasmopsis felis]|nr:hypothetical protein [Mycoplasmopsis felis]MCU9932333.1 hypothetical protein [Mycoplasmopsis felis]